LSNQYAFHVTGLQNNLQNLKRFRGPVVSSGMRAKRAGLFSLVEKKEAMSIVFGNICQSGYVVRDIDSQLKLLSDKAGIGPWFVARNVRLPVCIYRGQPIEMEMHAALANSGSHQIELIQQVSPAPSIYTEWLDRYPSGSPLQHVSSWEEDFDGAVERALANGWVMIQEGRSAYGPFAYMEHPEDTSVVFEITRKGPERRSIFEQVARAAANWDGSDGIREGWPAAQL